MARKYSLLINEEQLRLYTPISGTFDWAFITPHVIVGQDRDIQPLLGQPLFQRLLDGVNDANLTTVEEDFLQNFVLKCLAHWTMYHAYPFLPSKLIKSTLTRVATTDGEAVELDEALRLQNELKRNAEFYSKRLREHLENYGDLYDDYDTKVDGEIEPSNDKTYNFGINLTKI